VIETNKGTPAGVVAIIKSHAMDGSDLEILCAVFSQHEGQGLATQACYNMLSEVLNDPSVSRLIGCVDRENASSLALIRRLGGTFLKKRIWIKGEQDIYVFQ